MKKEEVIQRINAQNLNDYKYDKKSDCILYIPSGEIIHEISIITEYHKLIKDKKKKNSKVITNWKHDDKFTKTYHDTTMSIFNLKNKDAQRIFFLFTTMLTKTTNEVLIDGKCPTNEYIQDKLNIGRTTTIKALKVLYDRKYIHKSGRGKGRSIYINPSVAFNGKEVLKDTYNLFESE